MARSAAPPRPETLVPTQRARRDRIVAAASTLLERHAYEDVQMRDVAEQADVALGTLYRYFASKEHLFAAVLLSWGEAMRPRVEHAPLRGTTPAEQLADVYGRAIAAFERRPQFFRLYVIMETTSDEHARELTARFTGVTSGSLKLPLETLSEVDAEAVAGVLGSVLNSSLRGWSSGLHPISRTRQHVNDAIRLIFSPPPGSERAG
jgi:AcrR family transcriptional regulator